MRPLGRCSAGAQSARASPRASGARSKESMLVMSKESILVMSKESMLVMSKGFLRENGVDVFHREWVIFVHRETS